MGHHSDEDLAVVADDVAYEIGMLGSMLALVRQWDPAMITSHQVYEEPHLSGGYNAYLESLLLHARLLDDFLGRTKRSHSDDVLAVDYVPDWHAARVLTA